jgi:hypothetical protein
LRYTLLLLGNAFDVTAADSLSYLFSQAVGNDTDGALRDFAAKCLAEFLKWSIKQTTTKVLTDL